MFVMLSGGHVDDGFSVVLEPKRSISRMTVETLILFPFFLIADCYSRLSLPCRVNRRCGCIGTPYCHAQRHVDELVQAHPLALGGQAGIWGQLLTSADKRYSSPTSRQTEKDVSA
jgi:hypothetical protein